MTFTTVNYNPVGLTSEMLNALIKSWRSTAWRIKVQRPGGVKLFDAATAITTKIDDGTYHPISTSGTKYIKIVKDEKHNRTFVLHKNGLGGNYAVVSIINHDKLTTDMDYIEVVNKNTAIDWPTLNYPSTAVYALDMDYNPDKDELVLALRGSRLPNPTYLQPALMTISTAKYLPEIALNTCSTLKPNPDYLKCTVFRAPDGYMDCVPGCYFKFVRYLGGRYWTWALVATSIDGLGSNPLWQLGYFSAISHAYTLCFQYGLSPDSGASGHPPASTRADGSAWANAVTYPTQPRYQQVNGIGATGLITGTTDGYIGDSTGGLSNVVTFEINPMNGGSIILGTSPTTIDGVVADLVSGDTLYGMGGATKSYGMEPFIYRISIPVLLTELTEASRYIQDKTVAISAVYDSKSGDYLIPAQNIEANFPTPEASILGRNGGGLSYTRCVMSFPGTAQLNQQNYLALDGGFGVSTFISSFDGNYGYKSHSIGAFVPGNSALGRLCFGDASSNAPFTITITFTLYKAIPGLIEVIGVHSEVPLCAIGNTERPLEVAGTITLNSVVTDISVASKHFPTTTKYLKLHAAQWSSTAQKYSLAMLTAADLGAGLYEYLMHSLPTGYNLNIWTVSNSTLAHNYIGALARLNDNIVEVLSGTSDTSGNAAAVQFFYPKTETFDLISSFTAALAWPNAVPTNSIIYDSKTNTIGFSTGPAGTAGIGGEIWFYTPPTTDDTWHWSRDIRKWWDGTNPDVTMDGETSGDSDFLSRCWTFTAPSFSNSKQSSSNSLTFTVTGAEYLPWNPNSSFNGPLDGLPGVLDTSGMLGHGSRLILERGVYMSSGTWEWIQEGTLFVLKAPAQGEQGISDMNVTAGGVISMLITRAIYEGSHKPDTTTYTGVTLTSVDSDKIYSYLIGGLPVVDWATKPTIQIFRDGTDSAHLIGDYTEINSSEGTVTFKTAQTGHVIYGTFDAYNSGTNEAEDIILCILRYPNDLGGAGLDDSYFTRLLNNETLTSVDGLTYSFSKNMIVNGDTYNAIYKDAVLQTTGFTWDYRNGTVTFSGSQSGHTITGDAKHYTIQKSGATLSPTYFNPRKQKDAHDAIQLVCSKVAPNYIFREGRDGKLECDFMTQKSAGSEDITFDDNSRCLLKIAIDPAYEQLATNCISFGQADLSELPDYCIGCTVTDNWTAEMAAIGVMDGWHPESSDTTTVVDGDPATGMIGGWGNAWHGEGDIVSNAFTAAGLTGIPCLTVDMGEPKQVETIIIARPSGAAGAITTQTVSIWVSNDAVAWTRIIDPCAISAGANVQFKSGTNFDEGLSFQYIRVNLHSYDTYHNTKNKTDTQIGISEIQCYPPAEIMGVATLQDTDPDASLYDKWGLLKRYGGKLTLVARSGQADAGLYTQALADEDAKWNLEELLRLISKVEISSPWLPGVPWGTTIRVVNYDNLGIDLSYFLEDGSASDSGDTKTGMTLP